MNDDFDLIAEIREDQGKGASRRLRHQGKVPAIIYGAATAEAAVARKEAKRLEKRLERLLGYGKISPSIMGLSFFFAPCVPNALLGFTPPAWRHPVAPSRCVAYAALSVHPR